MVPLNGDIDKIVISGAMILTALQRSSTNHLAPSFCLLLMIGPQRANRRTFPVLSANMARTAQHMDSGTAGIPLAGSGVLPPTLYDKERHISWFSQVEFSSLNTTVGYDYKRGDLLQRRPTSAIRFS